MSKQIVNIILAFLLVFMVVVSPALAEKTGGYTVVHGGADDNEQVDDTDDSDSSVTDSDSVTDKIISDDYVFGFKRNTNYDMSKDLNLQEGFDIASSLPPWAVLLLVILLLAVCVIIATVFVFEWNTLKGAKSATNENPQKAADGIKNAKDINRAYFKQVIEGSLWLGGFLFLVWLLFM